MFGMRTRRRRSRSRRQLLHGRFRRLRVEPMEARLMLSVSSYGIDYSNLQVSKLPADNYRLVFAPAQIAAPSAGIEGGFINLGTDGNTSYYSDADSTPVLQGNQLNASSNDFHVLYQNGLDSADRAAIGQSNAGLQVLRYTNVGPSLMLEAVPTSTVVKLKNNQLNSSEGGAISIPTLVASMQREEHVAKNEESSLPTAIDTAGEPHRSVRSASSTKSLISGEWARAAMFETVSSERSANQFPDANDGHANDAADDSSAPINAAPASAKATSDEYKILGQHDDTSEKNNRSVPADRRRQQTSESAARPAVYRIEATDWNWVENVHRVASLIVPIASGRQAVNDLATDADDANSAVLATDALFDELGRPAGTMIESVPGDEPNLATRSAVPLLMILALERIATFNSRQSTRTSPTAVTRPRCQQL